MDTYVSKVRVKRTAFFPEYTQATYHRAADRSDAIEQALETRDKLHHESGVYTELLFVGRCPVDGSETETVWERAL